MRNIKISSAHQLIKGYQIKAVSEPYLKKARLLKKIIKVQKYLFTYLLKIVYSIKSWKKSQEKTIAIEPLFSEAAVKQYKILLKYNSRNDVYQGNFLETNKIMF